MNHALKAVIALGMGIGLAASAQAHGTYMHHAKAVSQRQAQTGLSRQQIKTAQQQLKSDGLYKGKVDGSFGPRTRMAVERFEQRNGLQRTATLNRQTFNRLTGKQAVGVGSSMPKTTMSNRNANGNGSGSSNNATTRMVPPSSSAGNIGAGNNTGTTNQNPSTNK
jgi:peptidoglycan hydrolase-like protein with peptidoglycan-binding domain